MHDSGLTRFRVFGVMATKRFLIEALTHQVGWQEGVDAKNVTQALERMAERDCDQVRFPVGCFVEARQEGAEKGSTYERSANGFVRKAFKRPTPAAVAESRWGKWLAAKEGASNLGHLPLQQAYSVECARCSASGFVPSVGPAEGNIFREDCDS